MTEASEVRQPNRPSLNRARLGQLAPLAGPALAFARRNPFILIGAAVVGVAGMAAWRNREKIAAKAEPMVETARAKGEALIEQARTAGEAVAARTGARRKRPAPAVAPASTEIN